MADHDTTSGNGKVVPAGLFTESPVSMKHILAKVAPIEYLTTTQSQNLFGKLVDKVVKISKKQFKFHMEITPKLAEEMLQYNIDEKEMRNRNVRLHRVKQYARDMTKNVFEDNGDPIRFGQRNDKLILVDGQHRLKGCIHAHRSFKATVQFNFPKHLVKTIDNGLTRTSSDMLRFEGYCDYTGPLSRLARLIYLFENDLIQNNRSTDKCTSDGLVQIIKQHEGYLETILGAREIMSHASIRKIDKHVAAFVFYLSLHSDLDYNMEEDSEEHLYDDPDDLDWCKDQDSEFINRLLDKFTASNIKRSYRFFSDFNTRSMLKNGDIIIQLHDKIDTKKADSRSKFGITDKIALMIKGWNAKFKKQRTVQYWNPDNEFPQIMKFNRIGLWAYGEEESA